MRFRPCIDIHNGKVKQIVGGSLKDEGDQACTNFSSELGAEYYAKMYKEDGLEGGHIILLNHSKSEYFQSTKEQALSALKAFPGGMQIGGGITSENAKEYLEGGASHVIVTSFIFKDGNFYEDRLKQLVDRVGREHIVLDLSCRKQGDAYYVVTDRWQNFTDLKLEERVMDRLSACCDEFLIHGVDVEGKQSGMEKTLVEMLGRWTGIPITYAGGIGSLEDLEEFQRISGGNIDFTIGSALDLFGGQIPYGLIKQRFSKKV